MKKHYDVIIVGTGVAGCFNALHLPKEYQILMITKDAIDKSNSFLAQGGVCVLPDASDREIFINDTLNAGHFQNTLQAVEIMVDASSTIIDELEEIGIQFHKENKKYVYTKEGAHSVPRILYCKDRTGKEVTSKLLKKVKLKSNITILEHTNVLDLLVHNNQCYGVVASNQKQEIEYFFSTYTVLATGGVGGLFTHSTNYAHIRGDALTMALKNDIVCENLEYIQFHPTTFYTPNPGQRFLISESLRGEGAVLYNKHKQRFVNELFPRDVLTKAIYQQMEKDQQPFVWLSVKHITTPDIAERFPTIVAYCKQQGIDPLRDDIPVVPAQHYLMGGIRVDLDGNTSMKQLYAVGETACNGVHGKNRLASNSLLESLVFAKRAAMDIAKKNMPFDAQTAHISKEMYQPINVSLLQKRIKKKMKIKE